MGRGVWRPLTGRAVVLCTEPREAGLGPPGFHPCRGDRQNLLNALRGSAQPPARKPPLARQHARLRQLLNGLGIDAAAHGFRSSFCHWTAECTDAPREVCQLALAHINSDPRGSRLPGSGRGQGRAPARIANSPARQLYSMRSKLKIPSSRTDPCGQRHGGHHILLP